jgi:hypothetical protein
MTSRSFILFFALLSFVAVLNQTALLFNLYWEWPWLDKIMHGLAGACVTLGALWLLCRRVPVVPLRRGPILASGLAAILCVGISWEIFEYVGGISAGQPDYWLDTIGDIVMDTLGGALGCWLFIHEYATALRPSADSAPQT